MRVQLWLMKTSKGSAAAGAIARTSSTSSQQRAHAKPASILPNRPTTERLKCSGNCARATASMAPTNDDGTPSAACHGETSPALRASARGHGSAKRANARMTKFSAGSAGEAEPSAQAWPESAISAIVPIARSGKACRSSNTITPRPRAAMKCAKLSPGGAA